MKVQRICAGCMFIWAAFLAAQLSPAPHAVEPAMVEQWGIFEVTLSGPTTGNPFTEATLSARFTQGDQRSISLSGWPYMALRIRRTK
jgi:hypothetical protein